MSDPAVPAVIVASIGNIELSHELRQIGFGRLDNQVKMVAHQYIGVHADAEDLERAPGAFLESAFGHDRRGKSRAGRCPGR